MKILFVSLFSLLLIHQSFAQKTEGTIHYKESIKLDIDLDALKDLPEAIKSQIPTEKSTENVLTFHPKASLYTNVVKDENEDVDYKSDGGDVQVQIQIENSDRSYFYDIPKKASIESQDFFGKKFLITNSKPKKWKISKETKEILGYTCTKATTTSDKEELIEAWFTSKIPVAVGPSDFHGLPGAVLSVRAEGGNYEIVATKIAFEKIDRTIIVAPTKGKKVKESEFKKIMDEKQKEMMEEYGGDGNMIIQTETIER
jgi:GLPGLI family protein